MKVKRKSTKRGADCLNEDFGESSTRRIGAYLTAETLETRHKLSHISPFVEVDRLEETGLWYSVVFTEVQEQLDVLHLQEYQQLNS